LAQSIRTGALAISTRFLSRCSERTGAVVSALHAGFADSKARAVVGSNPTWGAKSINHLRMRQTAFSAYESRPFLHSRGNVNPHLALARERNRISSVPIHRDPDPPRSTGVRRVEDGPG
jgi:hypothetical protein